MQPGDVVGFRTPDAGPLVADGVTVDTFTGENATANALITVSAGLDTDGDGLADFDLVVTSTDEDPQLVGLQVRADATGQFSYAIGRPGGTGIAIVDLVEVGGDQTGSVAIEYVAPDVRRFDFNTSGSPTQAPAASSMTPDGYVGVLPAALFSDLSGYGWENASTSGFDRAGVTGPQADLLRDGHFAPAGAAGARTFRTELVPGEYLVNVTIGDEAVARDRINLDVNGTAVTGISSPRGQYTTVSLMATVGVDGVFRLTISDDGGDPFWVINGLEILASANVDTVTFDTFTNGGSDLVADGTTVDMISGAASVPDGSLLTVTTDLGTILTDASPEYVGTQVTVTGGGFTFDLQRPQQAGTATLTARAVDGSAAGQDNTLATYISPVPAALSAVQAAPVFGEMSEGDSAALDDLFSEIGDPELSASSLLSDLDA
jgi:hypothetical protein